MGAKVILIALLLACAASAHPHIKDTPARIIHRGSQVNAVWCDEQTDLWCQGAEDEYLGQCKFDSMLYCMYVLRHFDMEEEYE